jgi:RHS repeat-associated protein
LQFFLNPALSRLNATQRNATQRKFKFFSLIALLFVCFTTVFSQSPAPNKRDFIPKSPEAAAFNKYGDIAVSKFTGSPNISFPLSLSEDVPISVSYNASGIKPEEHHGWVGAGWNLNVGGMISRVRKGELDEFLDIDSANVENLFPVRPYIENNTMLNGTDSPWNGVDLLLKKVVRTNTVAGKNVFSADLEPDEFVFNFNGFSGSFMLNHEGKWVIRGNNPAEFKIKEVNIQRNKTIKMYKPPLRSQIDIIIPRIIMGFTIVASDGTEYVFGGDQLSTDFTYNINGNGETTRYKTLYPMGWHLTKILPVNGKVINFIYEKDGVSMVLNAQKSSGAAAITWNPGIVVSGTSGTALTSFNLNYTRNTPDYSYTVMVNSYLSQIQTPYETIKFERSVLTAADAADYPYKNDANQVLLSNGFDFNDNKWFKLDAIKTFRANTETILRHFTLQYAKSLSNRLQLKGIKQMDAESTVNSQSVVEFEYDINANNKLPDYGSGQIDHWGYYTDNGGMSINNPSIYYAGRQPSANKMKAEILTKINYPTGGYTTFEFEPHDYHSVITKPQVIEYSESTPILPVSTADPSANEIAGGLRIKRIVSSADGVNTIEKTYKYVNGYSNLDIFRPSSGVLNGLPTYFDASNTSFTSPDGAGGSDVVTSVNYSCMNEQSLNPINLTIGSPVTYSEVVEIAKDNSYTIYKFSNFDNSAYCDRKALLVRTRRSSSMVNPGNDPIIDYGYLRGKLIKQKMFNNLGLPVQETVNEYTSSFNELKAVRAIYHKLTQIALNALELRAVSYLIHTSPVYLNKTTTKSYFYDPTTQASSEIAIVTENTYDSRQNIITQTVKHFNDTEPKSNTTTTFRYAYNPANLTELVPNPNVSESTETAGSQASMITKFMIGIPLVTVNNFNNGSKIEYKNLPNASVIVNGVATTLTSLMPAIFYNLSRTASFNEEFRINSYKDYDKPTETKAKGINTPVVTYDWQDGLLKSEVFGSSTNQLTWTYNYDFTKRLLLDKIDENGLRMKFTYDGYRRLSQVDDRYKVNGTTISDIQATTTYVYHYKYLGPLTNYPDDVYRNYISTISTFKGVTAPLSTKQYLDGLGRPIEVVKESYTPTSDLHSTANWHQKNYVSYDALGRQSRSYLPFESSTLGFQNNQGALLVAGYVETSYEASPLSRPVSQRNADGTLTYMSYGANIATDAVQIMVPSTTPNVLAGASSPNVYAINTLYKTTMTDENGKITCVFKDKLGRVILTRKLLNGTSGEKVDTYNVYDDYGQLVVVVPPGALTLGTNNSASVVDELTFQYRYDNKNRLSAKKIPGAKVQKFYYDSRDLLVLTQDGNMFAESGAKHLATLYDDLGRVIKTGFMNIYATLTEGAEVSINSASITDILTQTEYYPNRSWVKHQGAKVLKPVAFSTSSNFLWSYTERRAGLEYTGNPIWQGKQHLRYTSQYMSKLPITDADTYGVDWSVSGYNGMQQPDLTIRYLFEGGAGEVRTWQNFTYDNGRRLTDIKYTYGTGGAGISSPTGASLVNMNYNFKDQLIEKNIGYTGTSALQSIDYQYNIRGWLTNINNVALNTGGATNNINILTPTMLGTGAIQNLAIAPYLNKALRETTAPYRLPNASELPPLLNDGVNVDLFSQSISYESPTTPGSVAQSNGNISSTMWQILGRDKQAYGFKYDGLDRLTEANYFDINEVVQPNGQYLSVHNTIDKKFDETMTYDVRGNITSLKRNGLKTGSWTQAGVPIVAANYGLIDDLVYNYNPSATDLSTVVASTNSNKLLNVKDKSSVFDKGFKYVDGNAVPTYTYDDNGNLTSDLNKKIVEIKYNYLNLPQLIRLTSGGGYTPTIEFVYDATGVKLKKIVKVTSSSGSAIVNDVYDYINGVEYRNNVLQRVAHTEGSVVRNDAGTMELEYVLRDHLGNTRVTFSDANNDGIVSTTDIKQINHYYPFGLNMEGNWQGGASGNNKYAYNGKEWNDDFGLGWNDYGARFYDAAMGRFPNSDPSSDLAPDWTPYRYAFNNPLTFIDPDGLFETEAAAKAYAKEHHIKTGWFRQNKIVEQKDGSYAIENRKASTSTSNDSQFGVMTAALHVERGVHLADIGIDARDDLKDRFSESYNPDAVLKQDAGDFFYLLGNMLQWAAPSAAAAKAASVAVKAVGRGFASFDEFKAVFGAAGKGKAWHHIVEQGGTNVAKFGAKTIHNTENLIVLDHGKGSIHAQVSGYYSSKQPFTSGQTVRQWLSTQSFQQQYDFGIKILKQHGWTP